MNYYNGIRVESEDNLEMVTAMVDTSIRDSFTISCPEKIIQDKSIRWTNELRKNSMRKLRVPHVRMCRRIGNHTMMLGVGTDRR